MAKVTSDIHHVAHTYANPMVVSVSSATGRAYTMLHQNEWCYSDTEVKKTDYVVTCQAHPALVKRVQWSVRIFQFVVVYQ